MKTVSSAHVWMRPPWGLFTNRHVWLLMLSIDASFMFVHWNYLNHSSKCPSAVCGVNSNVINMIHLSFIQKITSLHSVTTFHCLLTDTNTQIIFSNKEHFIIHFHKYFCPCMYNCFPFLGDFYPQQPES